jgi:hypothetical protein
MCTVIPHVTFMPKRKYAFVLTSKWAIKCYAVIFDKAYTYNILLKELIVFRLMILCFLIRLSADIRLYRTRTFARCFSSNI